MPDQDLLATAQWRVSSYTGGAGSGGGSCVAVAALADGRVAVHNTNRPADGIAVAPRAALTALVAGIKADEF